MNLKCPFSSPSQLPILVPPLPLSSCQYLLKLIRLQQSMSLILHAIIPYSASTVLYSLKFLTSLPFPIIDLNECYGELQYTYLHHAAYNGHLQFVQFLIQHNVDINALTSDHWTALHLSCSRGYLDIVKLLCEHTNIRMEEETKVNNNNNNNNKSKHTMTIHILTIMYTHSYTFIMYLYVGWLELFTLCCCLWFFTCCEIFV